jgi:hypothetical protein
MNVQPSRFSSQDTTDVVSGRLGTGNPFQAVTFQMPNGRHPQFRRLRISSIAITGLDTSDLAKGHLSAILL